MKLFGLRFGRRLRPVALFLNDQEGLKDLQRRMEDSDESFDLWKQYNAQCINSIKSYCSEVGIEFHATNEALGCVHAYLDRRTIRRLEQGNVVNVEYGDVMAVRACVSQPSF